MPEATSILSRHGFSVDAIHVLRIGLECTIRFASISGLEFSAILQALNRVRLKSDAKSGAVLSEVLRLVATADPAELALFLDAARHIAR